MDNDIDLVVFNMNQPGNIKRVVFGENIGTTVFKIISKEKGIRKDYGLTQLLKKLKREWSSLNQSLAREFGGIRAGRANASLLDRVHVEYYGVETPLNQIASITIPEARVFVGNTIW